MNAKLYKNNHKTQKNMKIPYKSQLSRYKILKNRNKKFDSLSDEDKRKEIALDGLKQVVGGFVEASHGCYWSGNLYSIETKDCEEFQAKLNTPDKYKGCKVCQRGLIMLSTIRLGNNISSEDGNRERGDSINIKGFNIYNMSDMESEYEASYFKHPYRNNTNQKLTNICCNVISNGNFNKKDQTDYLKLWNIRVL